MSAIRIPCKWHISLTVFYKKPLTLHTAQRQPFRKIFLQEGIDRKQRDCRQKDLGSPVGNGNQETGYHGFKQTHRRTEGILGFFHSQAVHIGIDNISDLVDGRVVRIVDLFKSRIQKISQGQQGHQDNGGRNGRHGSDYV